jgi:hypothetical protein
MISLNGGDKFVLCASARDVALPTGYFFGLTAETGDVADNHGTFPRLCRRMRG